MLTEIAKLHSEVAALICTPTNSISEHCVPLRQHSAIVQGIGHDTPPTEDISDGTGSSEGKERVRECWGPQGQSRTAGSVRRDTAQRKQVPPVPSVSWARQGRVRGSRMSSFCFLGRRGHVFWQCFPFGGFANGQRVPFGDLPVTVWPSLDKCIT